MKGIAKAVLAVVVASGLDLSVAIPARAQTLGPAIGRHCGVTRVSDPTVENGDVRTGRINGGPLVATQPRATISMRCTIQVGAANYKHTGADTCSVMSDPTPQVTTVPATPALCSYLSPEGQPVHMCTQTTVDGVTYYWDAWRGRWSTSPDVGCNHAAGGVLFGPLCSITTGLFPGIPTVADIGPDGDLYVAGIWIVDCKPYYNELPPRYFPDSTVCPIFRNNAGTYGPIIIQDDGDVYLDLDNDGVADHPDEFFWDCPPYGS